MSDEEIKEMESVREKVLAAWKEGKVCFADGEGIHYVPFKDFVQQPLNRILLDLNRDEVTILTNSGDPKWVNDYCLTKLLGYYHSNMIDASADYYELRQRYDKLMDEHVALSECVKELRCSKITLEQSNRSMEYGLKTLRDNIKRLEKSVENKTRELFRLRNRGWWDRLINKF